MKDRGLHKSIALSFLGHLTVLSIFVVSFGEMVPSREGTNVNFWGGMLDRYDFLAKDYPASAFTDKRLLDSSVFLEEQLSSEVSSEAGPGVMAVYSSKPSVSTFLCPDAKLLYQQPPATLPVSLEKKDVSVVFHPVLPYHFMLYFKDRQVVNIELVYKVIWHGRNSFVAVERKTSSGNLEVDLLSMRHINHYLFIQRDRLEPDSWQKVKIEFSPQ